jgi:hypothetical protein
MYRIGATVVILLFSTAQVACRAAPVAARGTLKRREAPRPMMGNQEAMSFERVLQIAQSKRAGAKAQLEQLRDHGPTDAQLTMLARRILNRWNDGNNTYGPTPVSWTGC